MTAKKKTPPFSIINGCTDAERKLLELVLEEVRHAASIQEQLFITVDPYAGGSASHCNGANLFFSYNLAGVTEHVDGLIRRNHRRTHAAQVAQRHSKRFR